MQNRIKLMVIDDSAVYYSWLIGNLEKDSWFEIVGYTVNAFDAKNKIPVLKPDVLTLDTEMPGMSDLGLSREYLPSHPIPVILVSFLSVRVFGTLATGAVDFVREPDMNSHMLKEAFPSILMTRLTVAAASRARIPPAAPASPPSVKMSALRTSLSTKLTTHRDIVIAIGTSTGGTEATLEVLRQFLENMPSVIITQYVLASFTAMYTEHLNHLYKMGVREAESGDRSRPGLALLALGGLQMKMMRAGNGYAIDCVHEEKANGHCPSVDVFLDTVSSVVRDKAMGILLIGIGTDGATGLLRVRKSGAYTIGQDRDTCVVYGTPMETYKTRAVCQQSPLSSTPQLVINKFAQL